MGWTYGAIACTRILTMSHRHTRRRFLKWATTTSGIGTVTTHVATRPPTRPAADTDTPPPLALLATPTDDATPQPPRPTLFHLTFDRQTTTYQIQAHYRPPTNRQIIDYATTPHSVRVLEAPNDSGTATLLVVLDETFTPAGRTTLAGAQAIATTPAVITVAGQSGVTTFDTDPTQRGKLSFPEEYSDKDIERMLVYDQVAYLVDDVVYPLYLFRVDLSPPTAPRLLEVVPIEGINQSLGQQWLVPEADRWRFIQSTGHMEGSEQYVASTRMTMSSPPTTADPAAREYTVRSKRAVDRTEVYGKTRPRSTAETATDTPTPTEHGTEILDVTRLPPIFASIRTGDTFYLSSLRGDDRFGRELTVDTPLLVTSDPTAVVAVAPTGQLYWYDPEQATQRLTQELPITEPAAFTTIAHP